VNPSTMNQSLLPPKTEITDDEAAVLITTSGLKNTYAGQTDIRFKAAARSELKVTRERWDAATAALKQRGLLNAAGSITVSGRNAIANHPLRWKFS
jgi:hypothetical protein